MEDPDVADTVVRRRRVSDAGNESGEGGDAPPFDDADTLLRDRKPAPVSTPAEPRAQGSAHVESAAPQTLSRSALSHYRLSVNGGAAVPLDVATFVGRRPSAPRVPNGPPPRLVIVDSPRQEVSATHLEVHQQGTSVVVTDLRSTNGTLVTMPGSGPVRLRPGDSLVAGPGALIDLGDGNTLEILPIERLAPAASGAGDFP